MYLRRLCFSTITVNPLDEVKATDIFFLYTFNIYLNLAAVPVLREGQNGKYMFNACTHPSYHRAERAGKEQCLDYAILYNNFFLDFPLNILAFSSLFAR
jgi:hypothetical protein